MDRKFFKNIRGFSGVELVTIIAIVGVLLAIIVPVIISYSSDGGLVGGIILISFAIVAVIGICIYILLCVVERNKITVTITVAIGAILIFGICILGYNILKPNFEEGYVTTVSWEYTIIIEKKETTYYTDEDGFTHSDTSWKYSREVTTSQFDKNPYWGEVNLAKDERMGQKKETYEITIRTEQDERKTFECSRSTWDIANEGDFVQFQYRRMGNYITELYQ